MKKFLAFWLVLWTSFSAFASPQDRVTQWQDVDKALKNDQPQTASKLLQAIEEAASREEAWGEAGKAFVLDLIQEYNRENDISVFLQIDTKLTDCPPQLTATLRVLTAEILLQYYFSNRWQLLNRTETLTKNEDVYTWSAPRFLDEISARLQLALQESDPLKNSPASFLDGLLEKGTLNDEFRPTLYDFIAHRAATFYAMEETAAAKPAESFQFASDTPAFGSIDDFLAWKPETGSSPKGHALRIYQDLIRHHQTTNNETALAHCDLERLIWASKASNQGEDSDQYLTALRTFADTHAKNVNSARANFLLAVQLKQQDKAVEAHKVASKAYESYPNHPYGKSAQAGIHGLESKSLTLQTETHWANPDEPILVTHKNVDHIWFRLYSIPYKQNSRQNKKSLKKLFKTKTPILTWDEELEDPADYLTRTSVFTPPSDPELPVGFHYLVASSNKDFSWGDQSITYQEIHITKLALTLRSAASGGLDGFVLDAITGEPLENIAIKVTEHKRNKKTEITNKSTDKNGYFHCPKVKKRSTVLAKRGLERAVAQTWPGHSYSSHQNSTQTVFFTDRAIYRPGQTIHFKGICTQFNQTNSHYSTLANQEVAVSLLDINHKKVAKLNLTSNEHGSFAGTFIVPQGRGLGQYTLNSETIIGNKSIQVEEYKRPKFFTEVTTAQNEVALNQTVKAIARAESYTGAAIDGAKVNWTVTRQVRWPSWIHWCSWFYLPQTGSEEIAHGVGETNAQGSFELSFTAKPDLDIAPELEPVFNYLVTADITDGAGETRSASQTISVAYTTLRANLTTENWLTTAEEISVRIETESHDGEPRSAEGTLKIHRLIEPETCVRPENYSTSRPQYANNYRAGLLPPLDSDPISRGSKEQDLGELVSEFPAHTSIDENKNGVLNISTNLSAGAYRLIFESQDSNGKPIKAYHEIKVHQPEQKNFPLKTPFFVENVKQVLEPGSEYQLLWGSGYQSARALIEVYQDNKLLKREWTPENQTQYLFRFPVTEQQRGGFKVMIQQVNQNRLHQQQYSISVPWTQKKLKLSWEHIVSKLEPGAKESWTAIIESPDGEAAAAEMVATLYDASLDAFVPHSFPNFSQLFRQENTFLGALKFGSQFSFFSRIGTFHSPKNYLTPNPYRRFLAESERYLTRPHFFGSAGGGGGIRFRGSVAFSAPSGFDDTDLFEGGNSAITSGLRSGDFAISQNSIDAFLKAESFESPADNEAPTNNEAPVPVRTNLQETAFFYPQLLSGEDGKVRISFTMPEALTTWRFLGLAHDNELRQGLLEGTTVTALDLMIQPNPPRFLREGDELEFTAKIINLSDTIQTGTAKLFLENAATNESRNQALGLQESDLSFEVPAKQSQTVSWRLKIPDGEDFLRYKVTAATGSLSDGEEGWLPVLSRRVLVTESMALPIRDAGQKTFQFKPLLASDKSETIENRFLHVQAVSQPAWYGVMALPYLMEFPHECAEQTFSRYYANALGSKIVTSDPKIARVFELWKESDALDSPLEKNQDLKGIMLEETPWLAEAENQSEARRRVAHLFDENKLNYEQSKALQRIQEMQLQSGLWPWFPGGAANKYISLHITTGFARLRQLEVPTDISPALRALPALDADLTYRYQKIRREKRLDKNNLTQWIAHYLYTRTLFLSDKALEPKHKPAFEYFTKQAQENWTGLNNRLSRAHAALALNRLNDPETAKLITHSLRENAIIDEEQGMYWKDAHGWLWWQSPIESQAMMIEAFQEIDQDEKAVSDCQVWLIKQKQVSDWKTTKATTEAISALLMGGKNLLSSDALLEVSLGGETVKPGKVEPGTGFYEQRFAGEAVSAEQGEITLNKSDEGVSWASVHWQYLETIENVSANEGKELKLEKKLFVKRNTDSGKVLEPVEGPLSVGDELVTRLILHNDRTMEFVHLKDQRGSGTEPTNALSGYRWKENLGYYETTRDTASHFFIDHLPAGTHVFETSVRIQHRGRYETGLAEIRCMYAPEFAAHSDSLEIEVK